MSWLKSLVKLWNKDTLKDEDEKSTAVRAEVRRAIEETRAVLDGEDYWLIRPVNRNGEHCEQ